MNPIHVGILLNSALYLGSCFVAGLWVGNGFAWRLALAAMGVTYVGYCLQLADVMRPAIASVVGVSIVLGVLAGLSLLF